MAEQQKNELQALINELGNFLNTLRENASKKGIRSMDPSLKLDLALMKQYNILLHNLFEEALMRTGITREELRAQIEEGKKSLSEENLRYLRQLSGMRNEVDFLFERYKAASEKRMEKAQEKEKTDIEQRKRDIGFRKGWKKL